MSANTEKKTDSRVGQGSGTYTRLPVAGLGYGRFAEIRKNLTDKAEVSLRPVADNPYDDTAVEVWVSLNGESSKVGFIARHETQTARRILDLDKECVVTFDAGPDWMVVGLSTSLPSFVIWPPPPKTPNEEKAIATYRSSFPGEEEDPTAPCDEDELYAPFIEALRREDPDFDEEDDDGWERLLKAMSCYYDVVRDVTCDEPTTENKIGGLPYAEKGWSWPTCPCCGAQTVFVAQLRDGNNPDDLVQVFQCADEDMESCREWPLDEPETYSLVRLWRSPTPERMVRTAPESPHLVLPGHRLETDAPEEQKKGGVLTGGPAYALAKQDLANEGWSRLFHVMLDHEVGGGIGADLMVARRGRGRVIAFEEYG